MGVANCMIEVPTNSPSTRTVLGTVLNTPSPRDKRISLGISSGDKEPDRSRPILLFKSGRTRIPSDVNPSSSEETTS